MQIPRLLAIALVTSILGSQANAQWTVTNLHPAGTRRSEAQGVGGGQQVGVAYVGGIDVPDRRASLWSGTAASWVDLHPAVADYSRSHGVHGGQQVGFARVDWVDRASLWTGTAASWVDLNPAGSTASEAFGVHGGQQVGIARVGGVQRASLWSGTAASWVNLHPAGASFSRANGVHGGQQVGRATAGGVWRASLWTGTAASWVNLNPAGSSFSEAWGVHGGQQVGEARVGGTDRASLWTGTAASWVDLHPAGASQSYAWGVHGGQQVGHTHAGGVWRASLWTGTAASWVNLHAFLPAHFSLSLARSIWNDGTFIYVVGYGYNDNTARFEALMWRMTTSTFSGIVDFGQLGGSAYNSGANLPSSLSISYRDAANIEMATGTAAYNPVTGALTATAPLTVTRPFRVSFKHGFWVRSTMPNPASPATPLGNYNFGTIAPLVGDINGNNEITNADYAEWAATNGNTVTPNSGADLDGDGEVTNGDYALWAANNGQQGDD